MCANPAVYVFPELADILSTAKGKKAKQWADINLDVNRRQLCWGWVQFTNKQTIPKIAHRSTLILVQRVSRRFFTRSKKPVAVFRQGFWHQRCAARD